jgi:uncharacterized protein YhfF
VNPIDQDSAARLWDAYVRQHPEFSGERPTVERFGDSEAMADELLDLVLHGPKRATVGAVAQFAADGELLPRIGSHWIVADGSGTARAVLRSIELRIGPMDSVDEEFAWNEGEGDRSRASWLRDHRRYFEHSCARLGVPFDDHLELVFERFAVVWSERH